MTSSSTHAELKSTTKKRSSTFASSQTEQFLLDTAIASSLSIVASTCKHPTERLKLYISTTDPKRDPELYSATVKERPKSVFRYCAKQIIKNEGFFALWKGNFANCRRVAPQHGATLALNDLLKDYYYYFSYHQPTLKNINYPSSFHRHPAPPHDFFDMPSLMVNFACGGLAGISVMTLRYPLDFSKYLYANLNRRNATTSSLIEFVSTKLKSEGVLSLYRGLSSTLYAVALYRGLQLGLFSQIQESNANPYQNEKGLSGIVSTFCVAWISRAMALVVSNPFDAVRRRMYWQNAIAMGYPSKQEPQYKGNFDCFNHMIRREGVASFYRYFGHEVFKRGIGATFILCGYDRVKFYFEI